MLEAEVSMDLAAHSSTEADFKFFPETPKMTVQINTDQMAQTEKS